MFDRGYHEVIFGGGAQDLVHVPPARVTSATVQIEDLTHSDDNADRLLVPSTAATLDTYDVTTTAASGLGQSDARLMTHAGATATVGREYVIETAGGAFESFTCDEATATTLRSSTPLRGAYASGSHVRGVQLSVQFPALSAADEDRFDIDAPCRVRWTYTIAGVLHRVDELVRLVRSSSVLRSLGEVEAAVRAGWPELVRALSPHGNRLRDLVTVVARRLDARLRGKGIDPELLHSGGLGFELLVQRCVLQIAQDGIYPKTRDPEHFVDEQAREFARLWESLTVGQSAKGAADLDRITDMAAPGSSSRVRNPFARG